MAALRGAYEVNAQPAVMEEKEIPEAPTSVGCLIVNADDWGRDAATTDRIRECFEARAISSASAMVFMADSPRAAALAQQRGLDCGLHLNLTELFSATDVPAGLVEHQRKIARYLKRNRFAPIFFHPGLADSFEYVVAAQIEEFHRLFRTAPARIDGHHHMQLSANVLSQKLIPDGTIVRRNFSFQVGEKSWANRTYRKFRDRRLQKNYRVVDFLFNLQPIEPASRLLRIISLARHAMVELETHPVNAAEYDFLMQGGIAALDNRMQIAARFSLPFAPHSAEHPLPPVVVNG
ncbi:MAG: ChbG/HpnK family deacetylase [Candidatus Sulfotelmatobacter sp.]